MQTTFTYHQDPGHGWIEVQMAEVQRPGIAGEISRYSYRKGDTAYLEEDCDAGRLIEAKKARGEAYTFKEQHTNRDSFIRNLSPFQGAGA